MTMLRTPRRISANRNPRICPSCTGALCSIDVGASGEASAYWSCDCGYESEIIRPVPSASRG